jgi:hypothetical protein
MAERRGKLVERQEPVTVIGAVFLVTEYRGMMDH